jgi:hypothetical protein
MTMVWHRCSNPMGSSVHGIESSNWLNDHPLNALVRNNSCLFLRARQKPASNKRFREPFQSVGPQIDRYGLDFDITACENGITQWQYFYD